MKKLKQRKLRVNRRKYRIKKKIKLSNRQYRLCISRTNNNFYAQIIDDSAGNTVIGISTLSSEFEQDKSTGNKEAAAKLGKLIGEKAQEKGINDVVFDRNGYLFHGKIKSFADAVREAGLKF